MREALDLGVNVPLQAPREAGPEERRYEAREAWISPVASLPSELKTALIQGRSQAGKRLEQCLDRVQAMGMAKSARPARAYLECTAPFLGRYLLRHPKSDDDHRVRRAGTLKRPGRDPLGWCYLHFGD